MVEKLVVNNADENVDLFDDMDYIYADNVSEIKLKKLGLKNIIRRWQANVK
jgi:hypothetical protein